MLKTLKFYINYQSILIWTIIWLLFVVLVSFDAGFALLFFPLLFLSFFSLLISPFIFIWFLICLIRKNELKIIKVFISMFLGLTLGFIFSTPLTKYFNNTWVNVGKMCDLIYFESIQKNKKIKNFRNLPIDLNIKVSNRIEKYFIEQVSIIERNDSVIFKRPENIFDHYEWDSENEKWIYIDW